MAAATDAAGLTEDELTMLAEYDKLGRNDFAARYPERTAKGWESWAYRARLKNGNPDSFEKFDGDWSLDDVRAMYRKKTGRRERVHVVDLPLIPGEQYGHNVDIGDLHLGHPDCDYKRFEELRDWLLDNPWVRWMGNGDMLDLVTCASPGAGDQALEYNDAYSLLLADLRPIADQCDGLMIGNHEFRLARMTKVGVDPIRELAKDLGVPYLGYNCRVRYRVGGELYKVYKTHGKGGGNTPGGRMNSAVSLAYIHTDVDLCTMGHNHGLDFTFISSVEDDGTYVQIRKRAVALTGGFLQYKGDNYSRMKGYHPSVLGSLGTYFHSDRHNIHGRV